MLDQLRELTDVNGRLFKLLSEKEFEYKHMKKRWEKEKVFLMAGTWIIKCYKDPPIYLVYFFWPNT